MENTETELANITYSKGRGGKRKWFILPNMPFVYAEDYPCNVPRIVTGIEDVEMEAKTKKIIEKYFYPALIPFHVNEKLVWSNNSENAISEYRRYIGNRNAEILTLKPENND